MIEFSSVESSGFNAHTETKKKKGRNKKINESVAEAEKWEALYFVGWGIFFLLQVFPSSRRRSSFISSFLPTLSLSLFLVASLSIFVLVFICHLFKSYL